MHGQRTGAVGAAPKRLASREPGVQPSSSRFQDNMSTTVSGYWSFEKNPPRQVRRDPFEAEFFTGEDDDDSDGSRTDSLVREVLQNSLDAARGEEPVRVRIAIDREVQLLSPERAEFYLRGLVPHLDALGNTTVNGGSPAPEMDYLVVEDFGTHGLTGNPARSRDPEPENHVLPESFYWFWRNIGRSGKTGNNRGRWGLGKTVFPSASKINTFFGLTRRSSDARALLMGQAITKIHTFDGAEFLPEGFFSDPCTNEGIQMPFENEGLAQNFCEDFRLARGEEPGLSIVIPYPVGQFLSDDLARSVILHFFIPILSGDLEVEVDGDGDRDFIINRETIEGVSNQISWNGSVRHKLHRAPPFDLARWAIKKTRNRELHSLKVAGKGRVPNWSELLFAEGQLDQLRETFEQDGRIAVRVPILIERKLGGPAESHFDVFLEKDADAGRPHDYFIREGMTISRISTLSGIRGLEGLVLVHQGELSRLLGDAEGPTHTEWGTGESRPEERYVKWKRRITFVRTGIARLFALLSPPPAELQEDWLKDVFSIQHEPEPTKIGPKKKREMKSDKPKDFPERKPQKFNLSQKPGGFCLEATPDEAPPVRIQVRLGYDLPTGNPLSKWSHFDFVLDDGKSGQIRFDVSGARVEGRKGNAFEVIVEKPAFRVELSGFDPRRDLYCKATIVEDGA